MIVILAGDSQLETLLQLGEAPRSTVIHPGRADVAERVNDDLLLLQPRRQLQRALAPGDGAAHAGGEHVELRLMRISPGEIGSGWRSLQYCNRFFDKSFGFGAATAHPRESRQAGEVPS